MVIPAQFPKGGVGKLIQAGLDKLSGFAIDSVGLIPKAQDGSNVAGTATLPNHSVFTFALVGVALYAPCPPLS